MSSEAHFYSMREVHIINAQTGVDSSEDSFGPYLLWKEWFYLQ